MSRGRAEPLAARARGVLAQGGGARLLPHPPLRARLPHRPAPWTRPHARTHARARASSAALGHLSRLKRGPGETPRGLGWRVRAPPLKKGPPP